VTDGPTLDTKTLDRFVVGLLAKGQAHADLRKNEQVEPAHFALALLQSDAGAGIARSRGLDVDALCMEVTGVCNALPGTSPSPSYLSSRALEVVAATTRLAKACELVVADLSIFMRVLASHGHLPAALGTPWTSEERALFLPLAQAEKAPIKPAARIWGPELTVRELRRELEARFGGRSPGAIEAERFLVVIGDRLPGFDVTPDVGRVDLERDGRTLTLEWKDDDEVLELRVEAGARSRKTSFAWSLELKTFVAADGRDLLATFRETVLELAEPVT
jgi:hypothetical protein